MRRMDFMPLTTAEAPVYSPKNGIGRPIFFAVFGPGYGWCDKGENALEGTGSPALGRSLLLSDQGGAFAGGLIQTTLTLVVLDTHTVSMGMV